MRKCSASRRMVAVGCQKSCDSYSLLHPSSFPFQYEPLACLPSLLLTSPWPWGVCMFHRFTAETSYPGSSHRSSYRQSTGPSHRGDSPSTLSLTPYLLLPFVLTAIAPCSIVMYECMCVWQGSVRQSRSACLCPVNQSQLAHAERTSWMQNFPMHSDPATRNSQLKLLQKFTHIGHRSQYSECNDVLVQPPFVLPRPITTIQSVHVFGCLMTVVFHHSAIPSLCCQCVGL